MCHCASEHYSDVFMTPCTHVPARLGQQHRQLLILPECICVGCSSDCDNKLTFCLRELGSTGQEISGQTCLYGSFRTTVVGGDNLEFTAGRTFDGEVPNPVEFTGSRWKVSPSLPSLVPRGLGTRLIITLKFMVMNSVVVVDQTLFMSR